MTREDWLSACAVWMSQMPQSQDYSATSKQLKSRQPRGVAPGVEAEQASILVEPWHHIIGTFVKAELGPKQ